MTLWVYGRPLHATPYTRRGFSLHPKQAQIWNAARRSGTSNLLGATYFALRSSPMTSSYAKSIKIMETRMFMPHWRHHTTPHVHLYLSLHPVCARSMLDAAAARFNYNHDKPRAISQNTNTTMVAEIPVGLYAHVLWRVDRSYKVQRPRERGDGGRKTGRCMETWCVAR